MARSAKNLILALLTLAAIIQGAFILYASNFAFRLRATAIPSQSSVTELNLTCRPPASLAPGTYNLTVEATDTAGQSVKKNIKVNVIASAALPQCSDGVDNDGDGLQDTADSGCSDANDASEYSPSVCQDNNMLSNGGFEETITTSGTSPRVAATWDLDKGANSAAVGSLIPLSGTRMWHFSASQAQTASEEAITSDLWQLIPLPASAKAGDELAGEVFFNRVGGDSETDTEFIVQVRTYNFSLSEFPERWTQHTAESEGIIVTDGVSATWQRATAGLKIPAGTVFIGYRIAPKENVKNDATSPEFDGHVADEACLQLLNAATTPQPLPPPPPSATNSPAPSPAASISPAPVPPPPPGAGPTGQPHCSDGSDNDGDILVDSADTGCHTDGNPNNPRSYVPSRASESPNSITQCTDSLDNDRDGLVDGGDPQCHTDGNPLSLASYNPLLATEQGADGTTPRCFNKIDDDKDGAIDTADSGCHTDGNPLNTKTYNANDQDEGGNKLTECSDNIDNDKDKFIDGGDKDCHTNGSADDPGTYDPTFASEKSENKKATPTPSVALRTFMFQAETGHTVRPGAGGSAQDGSRQVLALYRQRATASRSVSVPPGDYWLSLTAKHDRPGPVDVGVYINGRPWKSLKLTGNDDVYRTHTLGRLQRLGNATISFRFLQDRFEGTSPDIDRNLYIDSWALSTQEPTSRSVGGSGSQSSAGQSLMPQLSTIIREELGPEHLKNDTWQFYARRLNANIDSRESIISEQRLRSVMRYWRGVNPTRPRGS